MDPWTTVRAMALECRERASGAREQGETLLAAAMRQADLVTCTFSPGSPGFGVNVRARLIRPASLVYVSDELVPEERDFVVAHELGHFHLHSDVVLEDTVAAPTSRGTTVGVVDGYSTRELKEVQADLFAAEFLCPTSSLRRALAMGGRPSSMVVELGVPTSVVMRQAAAALLGPTCPGPGRGSTITGSHEHDVEQDACVTWCGGALLVEGGPGSGKTSVLVRRAWRLTTEVPPARILVIVASDHAAQAARSALAARGDAEAPGCAPVGVLVCTFADLALEIVLKWPDRIGLVPGVQVVNRPVAPGTPPRAVQAVGARGSEDGVDRVASNETTTTAIRILRSDPRVLRVYRDRFAHVLVDDLQAATPDQAELLELLRPPGHGLVAAGDAGQSIRTHRGADGRALAGFIGRHEATRIVLRTNHRSGGAAAALLARLDGDDTGASEVATMSTCSTADDEASIVRDNIEALRTRGVGYSDQVVLARTHGALDAVADRLEALGVPLLRLRDLHRRGDVRDLLALLAFVADGDPPAFRRLGSCRAYGASGRDLDAVQRLARRDGSDLRETIRDLSGIDRMSSAGRAGFANLRAHLDLLVPAAGAASVLSTWLFELSDYLRPLLVDDAGVGRRTSLVAIHETLRLCEEQAAEGASGIPDLVARLGRFGSIATVAHAGRVDLAAAGLDAVSVMTIHAASGREFEAVHLTGASAGIMPPARTDPDEERRLFRVALSRSRGHVHLSRAERREAGDARRRAASPHLLMLGDALAVTGPAGATIVPTRKGPPRRGTTHLEADLAAYLACPRMYELRLGRDRDQPWRRDPDGAVGTTWRIPRGEDTIVVVVDLSVSDDGGAVEVRHVDPPGTPLGRRRMRALPGLLAAGAARELPGREIRLHPSSDPGFSASPEGGKRETRRYDAAAAAIAARAFGPKPEGAGTCAACPHYFLCRP